MVKIGIIAEFNPFHNGHIYLIDKVKEIYPDSFITVITSTNFTERGEISLLTKWDKTKICLNHKIDLVLEIPFFFAVQSADIFSTYAVSILEYMDMDYLVFGSECGDINTLKNLASTTLYNDEYDRLVKGYLDLGNSYPASTSKALYDLTNIKLINSNDILGVTYIKTILLNDYKIIPITIKRTNSYLSKKTTGKISSASSIRELYLNNKDYKEYVPNDTYNYLNVNRNYQENFFKLLKYKLITEINDLNKYLDVSEGIDYKIKKIILQVNNYEELIDKLKSKRYTYNKLNRMFLHILFNITKEMDFNINYIRVLGFNKLGRDYIRLMKNEITIPIITNYKEINDEVLSIEKLATIIYLNIVNKSDLIKEELMSVPINH